jgi:hypothetical protein
MKNVAVLLLVALLGSCTSSYKTVTVDTRSISSSQILQTPVVCDLVVADKKSNGTFTGKGISVDYAKSMAVNDALFKSNGDILIEPNYTITTSGKKVTVDVQGFVGKYKNFQIPAVDTTLYRR